MLRNIGISSIIVLAGSLPVVATPVVRIESVQSAAKLFCQANQSTEAVVIISTTALKSLKAIRCPLGEFQVRVRELNQEDPGHAVANIDPPKGVASAFDCDAKYDIGQSVVAFNCLRSSLESTDHIK